MRRMRLAALGSALVLAGGAGCGGGDGGGITDPTAGVLRVVLTSPNADDGALLITIVGAPIARVEPSSAQYQLYTAQPDSLTTRVLLTGNVAAGDVLRLHVADIGRRTAYHATVVQAASRATFAQQPVAAYSLAVTE